MGSSTAYTMHLFSKELAPMFAGVLSHRFSIVWSVDGRGTQIVLTAHMQVYNLSHRTLALDISSKPLHSVTDLRFIYIAE